MKLLKLIRFENLLLLAAAQLLFKFGFLDLQEDLPLALNTWQYLLFVAACVFIAAGGALMDNISGSDRYNQHISEEKGYNIYMVLTVAGIALGGYIAYLNERTEFVAAFLIGAAMLYIAVTNFRSTLLIPNILVSLTVALSVILIGVFNFYPFMKLSGSDFIITFFDVLLDYSYFAFVVAFMHTLTNDLVNTDSDYNSGKATLPIVIGRERAAKILFFITILPVAMILYYLNTYLSQLLVTVGYTLLFVVGPLIYFAIKLWTAKTNKDFGHLKMVLKLVLFFAALSIMVINLNIKYNA